MDDDRRQLLDVWRAEETGQPPGWDFSSLEGRMTQTEPAWDFNAEVRAALPRATRVLDMGTGGGEHLRTLTDLLPADTTATEGWAPNVPVARAALTPYAIDVVDWGHDEDDPARQPMPFPDDRFDLVINRHESYDPIEVRRVLCPGGMFLTQQVGGDEFGQVHAALGHRPTHPEVTYTGFSDALLSAGFELVGGAEHIGHYSFTDVAALIAYLQLVPWDVPDDFSVDRYADELIMLHESGPAHDRPLEVTCKRFWLAGRVTPDRPRPTADQH